VDTKENQPMTEIMMRLPEKVLELVVFSKKQTETLYIHISLEQGRLKIQKPFTHAQNVLI
jgi:hypothetical protein